jgi:hypothetical protein
VRRVLYVVLRILTILLPQRARYPCATAITRLFVLSPGRSLDWRGRYPYLEPESYALRFFLDRLSAAGVRFDPAVRTEGDNLYDLLASSAKGFVLLTPHLRLNPIVPRYLLDHQRRCFVIAHEQQADDPVWGLADSVPYVPRGPHCLLQSRRRIQNGEILILAMDLPTSQVPARTIRREDREFAVYPNAFHFAAGLKVPIVFSRTSLDPKGVLRIMFRRLPPGLPIERQIDEYTTFLDETLRLGLEAHRRASPGWARRFR